MVYIVIYHYILSKYPVNNSLTIVWYKANTAPERHPAVGIISSRGTSASFAPEVAALLVENNHDLFKEKTQRL